MLEQAKKSILDSGDFLPQDQIAQRLDLPPMAVKTAVDGWEARGHIFSIEHAGGSLFPTYAFQDWVIARTCPPICIRPDQSFASDMTSTIRGHDRQRTTDSVEKVGFSADLNSGTTIA